MFWYPSDMGDSLIQQEVKQDEEDGEEGGGG